MRLIIIRHGDPDYENDALTPRGKREAEALQERMRQISPDYVYVSPLGRAKETCEIAMKGIEKEKVTKDWLEEFTYMIYRPDLKEPVIYCWDWLPKDWAEQEIFYGSDTWYDHPVMQEGHIKEAYEKVIAQFRELLKEHGYERDGKKYRVLRSNHDTIVFFCHFGLECVLLSDLLNVSPMILWHNVSCAPTSVCEVYTEERTEGIASFRASKIGDVSHLYKNGIEPSFACRFCECYEDDARHV